MAKIYVGNLPFTATEDQVRALFAAHGTVESVALPMIVRRVVRVASASSR